jgi:predicted nucleotidyltransferase
MLTGSLTSPDFDKQSDVDVHIVLDMQQFADPKLMADFLATYAKNYNTHEYDLRGHSLELYFQDASEKHISPGIYDILSDRWIKAPDGSHIVITPEMLELAEIARSKVQDLIKAWGIVNKEDKSEVSKFLLDTEAYYQMVRKARKDAVVLGGLASVGNQVFRLLRRNGTLEALTNLIDDIQDEIYEA